MIQHGQMKFFQLNAMRHHNHTALNTWYIEHSRVMRHYATIPTITQSPTIPSKAGGGGEGTTCISQFLRQRIVADWSRGVIL